MGNIFSAIFNKIAYLLKIPQRQQVVQTVTYERRKQDNPLKNFKKITSDNLFDKLANEVNELNTNAFYKKFITIRNQAVNEFYNDYWPHYYKRKYSLRYMAYPRIEDETFFFDLGVDTPGYFASHHQDEQYIYENSFVQGFHGGYDHKGGKYWRTPYPKYTRWGRPAEQGPSPYNILLSEWEKFENGEMETISNNNVNKVIQKYYKELIIYIDSEIEKTYSRKEG